LHRAQLRLKSQIRIQLIHQEITIIIQAITEFRRAQIGALIQGSAILAIGITISIAVLIAKVQNAIRIHVIDRGVF